MSRFRALYRRPEESSLVEALRNMRERVDVRVKN